MIWELRLEGPEYYPACHTNSTITTVLSEKTELNNTGQEPWVDLVTFILIRAIYKINNYTNYGEVNCLVFISAQLNTTKLPELNPTSMGSSATIVAVGFNGTDLTGIVDQRGTAVSVPYEYNATDAQNVVEAVLNT
ncbi:hypothetical protein COOONC_20814 [Cooperia oncophora]